MALQALSSLTLVLSLIGLLYWLVYRLRRRFQGPGLGRQITILEKVPLGDKRALLLVRVGERPYLVGSANGSISMLTEVELTERAIEKQPSDSSEDPPRVRSTFRTILEAIR